LAHKNIVLDHEEVCFHNALECGHDGGLRLAVASVQNPCYLAKHENRDKERLFLLTAILDEFLGSARLPRVVSSQIPAKRWYRGLSPLSNAFGDGLVHLFDRY
jgi:hypothetical protein